MTRIIKVNSCSGCPYVTEAMTCELTGTEIETETEEGQHNYYTSVMNDCPLDEIERI